MAHLLTQPAAGELDGSLYGPYDRAVWTVHPSAKLSGPVYYYYAGLWPGAGLKRPTVGRPGTGWQTSAATDSDSEPQPSVRYPVGHRGTTGNALPGWVPAPALGPVPWSLRAAVLALTRAAHGTAQPAPGRPRARAGSRGIGSDQVRGLTPRQQYGQWCGHAQCLHLCKRPSSDSTGTGSCRLARPFGL